jgi:hypothetical protein
MILPWAIIVDAGYVVGYVSTQLLRTIGTSNFDAPYFIGIGVEGFIILIPICLISGFVLVVLSMFFVNDQRLEALIHLLGPGGLRLWTWLVFSALTVGGAVGVIAGLQESQRDLGWRGNF